MIGGRVLDSSALAAFAAQRSVYATALVWTAVEESIVLVLPATAVAGAWWELNEGGRFVLEVLLRLPVAVVDPLDLDRARIVGERGGDRHAHTAVCAAGHWSSRTPDATAAAR